MINTELPQYDESIDKKLDKVILKEDDIISDIAEEHEITRKKIDDYGTVINAIKDDTYKIYAKSMIKSIQRGITNLNPATTSYATKSERIIINDVDMNKSIVVLGSANVGASTLTYTTDGSNGAQKNGSQQGNTQVFLENSTTLMILAKGLQSSGRDSGGGSSGYAYYSFADVAWQVIEFY